MPLPPMKESPIFIIRWLMIFKGSILFLILFSTLLIGNAAQTASLIVKPFSQKAFRRANRFIADTWWGFCVVLARLANKTDVRFYGDDVPQEENAVVMLNHQEMADIPVLFVLARMKKRLGDLKWFAKDILKHVPGIGWGMRFLDCPFVKRNWTEDKDYINNLFKKFKDNEIPIWLMTFLEGTRIRPEKVEASNRFAEKAGLKPLRHVLIPRTKGFVASIQALREHLDAVYDVTIAYVEGVPTIWQWVKGNVKRVNVHVQRFHIDELPIEADLLEKWAHKRYEMKDKLLDFYYKFGRFPSKEEVC